MKKAVLVMLALILAFPAFAALDDEAYKAAQAAKLPDGLSDREAELYRQAYAEGYYAALHPADEQDRYILNTNSHKFHKPGCSSAASISKSNRQVFEGTRDEVIRLGYTPCGVCNP